MKNNSRMMRLAALGAAAVLGAAGLAGCGGRDTAVTNVALNRKEPTVVTVWNYYNGEQQAAFERLMGQFNDTVGAEKGIVVTSISQGNIGDLADALLDSVEGKVGAADVPSTAAVYPETAYVLQEKNAIVPLDAYFTAEELAGYVPTFLEEGRLQKNGDLLLMPVSKSTEVQITNTTDWAPFAEATGVTLDSMKTFEDLTAAAQRYYEWTDSLTPEIAEDGKALFGRDSVANYIFIGTKQLGHPMFTVDEAGELSVDLDRDTFKTLWDNYYIPYINGYFGSYGRFRSEDLKTGDILTLVGASSGVSYYPDTVTNAEDVSHDIDIEIGKPLPFANAVSPVYVQQGAGYCVMQTSEAEQQATVEFLKWFTDSAQNLDFSVSSGYSPVKQDANDAEKIAAAFTVDSQKQQNMLEALLVSAEIYAQGNTYTSPAFAGSKQARADLEQAFEDACTQDRAAVVEAIAGGATRAQAVEPYSSEEYFDAWFEQVRANILEIMD